MNGKANKVVIGAFVLGALVLLVVGVLIFGSGKLFADTWKFVVYFEGSVKGLSVGSPVMFRGVKIGTVTDIQIAFDPQQMVVIIPIIIDVEKDTFQGEGMDRKYLQELIAKGLRAQLQMQSIVTGQLAVYLDFFPGSPVVLRGKESARPEIPSILSKTEELQKTLAELPLEELVEKMHSAMEGVDRLANSPELHAAVSSLGTTAREVQEVVRTLDGEIRALGQEGRRTTAAATKALNQMEKFLTMEEGATGEMARNINETLVEARATFDKTQEALEAVRQTASDERSTYQLQRALQETAAAARAVNTLVDYLERHPEALLRGKGALKGE
ncbi:MAG TPA: MlaD family protein [Desulfuromonadales bacterium]|nr:MlaD family protein [Desulfuromonadales bacterium]